MEIGCEEDDTWRPWPDAFGLEFDFRVRSSPVYLHYDIVGKADTSSSGDCDLVDKDCSDNDAVGLFLTP